MCLCKSSSEPPTQSQPGFAPPVKGAGSYSCKHQNSQRKPTGNVNPSTLQSLGIIYQQLQEQHCANTISRTTAKSPEHLLGFMEQL